MLPISSGRGPLWWTQRRINRKKEKIRVLVVDDYEIGAHALAAYLSLDEIDCRTAIEGAAALDISVSWVPHIILMDISMPILNGIEAARALRQNDITKAIVIVAFTALNAQDVLHHLTGDEFDGYCQKGYPPDKLLNFMLSSAR